MGRSLERTATRAAVGETRALPHGEAPRICHVQGGDAAGDWQHRLGRAAALGFDHVCVNPFLSHRNDPLLISDLAAPNPALAVAGSTDKAVAEIVFFLFSRRGGQGAPA